jgi:hypothetical protein
MRRGSAGKGFGPARAYSGATTRNQEEIMSNAITQVPERADSSKGLRIGLWIAQGLLALAFLGAGVMKLTAPIEALAQMGIPGGLARFIGLAEVAGALGVILPAATRVKPWLTPLAAVGLTTVMVLAAGFHIMRGEASHLGAPLVLGALAAFVAWGRATRARIAARA